MTELAKPAPPAAPARNEGGGRRGTIVSIQYLRGIAALLVVFQHVAKKCGQYSGDSLASFHIGGAGVDVFFIISGFIMCHTTAEARGSPAAVAGFLRRRFVRIIPLYWFLTLAALAVYLINPALVNSGDATRVAGSFLLTPGKGVYLIANGWTLSFEFFFYAIFALGMMLDENRGRALTAAILGGLVTLGFIVQPRGLWMMFFTFPMLAEFIVGMGLYFVHRRFQRLPPWFAVVLVMSGAFWLRHVNLHAITGARVVDYGVPATLICTGIVGMESLIRQRIIPFLETLGDISYSLYLVHPFALTAVSLVFLKLHLLKPGYDWVFIAALAAAAISAGWLCCRLLEQPLTRLAKNLFLPRKARLPSSDTAASQMLAARPR